MATLRAGNTQNTQLSKVLGERRNPRTGGGQGTSGLPQGPLALPNLKGEPSPAVRHTSLVPRIHHWLSSWERATNQLRQFLRKGRQGLGRCRYV